ncbi:nose resistant to fluoxetine protein 6-like [Ptychodera flava]|uniref:nose resistant to fluoxetine protein 6-like n=1 Tax=Ptychodera flava TaxID=63121 RepID=UPI00396A37FD
MYFRKGFALYSVLCLHLSVGYSALARWHRQLPLPVDDTRITDDFGKVIGLRNEEALRQLVYDTTVGLSLQSVAGSSAAILSGLTSVNISERCVNDTRQYFDDILARKLYALKMFDSTAKPPAGIFEGNFEWVGAPEECRGVDDGPGFKGKYCQTYFPLSKTVSPILGGLFYGVCAPDTCQPYEILEIFNRGLGLISMQSLQAVWVVCTEEDQELTTGAIVMLAIVGVLLFLMIAGTVYQLVIDFANRRRGEHVIPVTLQDDVREDDEIRTLIKSDPKNFIYEPGIVGQCLLAFSVLENGRKILDTRHAAGTLAAIHGIRVLSMWWVILGHSYAFPLAILDNLSFLGTNVVKRFTFQAINNGTFSVDTFFFLSGLLVTYLTLKELKSGRNVNWFIFYAHRFWRLTPMYMFVIFVSTYLVPYFGNGPYKTLIHVNEDPCVKYWWTNLLYINNLYPWPGPPQCYGVSWYLANDMQFHLISPIVILLLYKLPIVGYGALSFLLCGCLATRAALGVHYDLTSNSYDPPLSSFVTSPYYYFKPWTRIATYIVGMCVGCLLVKTNCQIKINKVINFLCWLAAWAIALAVLYGLYGTLHGVVLSRPVDIFYMAVCRTAWGVAIGWLTFACLTGNGGPINSILAWKAWIPISRLTYAAYLVHPMVIFIYLQYRDRLIHATDLEEIYIFISSLVITYCASFVVSLMTEAPMMKLERILLKKDNR